MIDERISSGSPVRDGVEGRRVVMQLEHPGRKIHRDVAAERAEDIEDLPHVGDVGHAGKTAAAGR
ncbi:MAG: hypothetical protein WDN30_02975 [Pararobbsia sp.]